MLRLALHARSRTVMRPYVGQLVYYWRQESQIHRGSYHGPAKVLAVEDNSVVWVSHGTTLVRAAPEHLRLATPLEVSISDTFAQHTEILGNFVKLGPQPNLQDELAEDADEEPVIVPSVSHTRSLKRYTEGVLEGETSASTNRHDDNNIMPRPPNKIRKQVQDSDVSRPPQIEVDAGHAEPPQVEAAADAAEPQPVEADADEPQP
eukprot:1014364-Amphidinium_carterae.1